MTKVFRIHVTIVTDDDYQDASTHTRNTGDEFPPWADPAILLSSIADAAVEVITRQPSEIAEELMKLYEIEPDLDTTRFMDKLKRAQERARGANP